MDLKATMVAYPERYVPRESPLRIVEELHDILRRRRSIREFSDRPVDREVIEGLVKIAATAPSGANKQPWRFVAVSNPELKRKIREGAEEEERLFYSERASEEWLRDLSPLGTDDKKEFLEIAPWLLVVFRLSANDDGSQVYYTHESVGIAVGMLLAAAQCAGLATLTHTPSPMKFLREILGRPKHEHPYLLIPIGYPTESCEVPQAALVKKPTTDILVFAESSPKGRSTPA